MSQTSRATISLALIVKNEEKNISRLLDSVDGCFDEIILVDTGSTDKTVAIAVERGCEVHNFKWVNSFCKARNFVFSKCTKDFIMWMDADDVLGNKEAFLKWRNHAMKFHDMYFATYNYAIDNKSGKPIISFVRERVFRRSLNPTWQYDLHEGIITKPEWSKYYITTWTVDHMRDQEDIKADKSRNINILEEMRENGSLDSRMQFYYGKELYECGRYVDALYALEEAVKKKDLEPHDKLLSYQYGSYAALSCFMQTNEKSLQERGRFLQRAIELGCDGIKMDPNRAELHVAVGDCYIQANDFKRAIPYFAAAKKCWNDRINGCSKFEGAIYSFVNCYGEVPSLQLARIYFNIGQMELAEKEAKECIELYNSNEAKEVLEEILRVKSLVTVENGQHQTDDIVFTTPPMTAYPFDEELYKTKPLGGSETALVSIAKYLKKHTKRSVKVFQPRPDDVIAESGVEYLSNKNLNAYMAKNKPYAHIAWRHNIRVTNAKTYLWCHDLTTATVESIQNFDKILCLSPFHKNYVQALQGVSDDKVIVTRNGLNPEKFNFERKPKNKNKIVWMSSPDRGLDRAMVVCDRVRQSYPDIELHVYYGIENLYKYGLGDLADKLKGMMQDRPWVKYHGFTEQDKMYRDVSDAVVWCHPCNFIETYCITANEMLALGVFPVTRKLGALADTLRQAELKGHAILLDHDAVTEAEVVNYAKSVCRVLEYKLWENIEFNIESHSWEGIAKEWVKFMEL